MKRKIALLLALAMTASMLPVNAFATSSNEVNKVVSVKDEDSVDGVFLKITPREEVSSGDSIVLRFTNSEVQPREVLEANGFENFVNSTFEDDFTYEYAMEEFQSYYHPQDESSASQKLAMEDACKTVFTQLWGNTNDAYLPWKLERNGKSQITVRLFPISATMSNKKVGSLLPSNQEAIPHYYIPLLVNADGEGDMTVAIEANETTLTDSTLTFAKSTNDSGATVTTVDEVQDFNESLTLSDANGNAIRIEETVAGTFEKGTLTIRINGGFVFAGTGSDIVVAGAKNDPKFTVGTKTVTDSKIEIEFTEFQETKKASAITISGITIEPDDEDDDWGVVNFTFRGIGMTGETIQVANRADYGMSLTLDEEATSIFTGFSYPEDSDLDEDDFLTAYAHVEETIADTWNSKQKLYFKLPEGVKIISFETKDLKNMDSAVFDKAYLTDGGSTLVVTRTNELTSVENNKVHNAVNPDECSEFDIRFNVTIDPAFGDNDITLSMYGAGVEEGAISDLVIAKAVTPITVATETTKTNIGYSAIETADITITENAAGALRDDRDVVLSIDTLWTLGDIGFDTDDTAAEATGELEIGKLKGTSGTITIPVEKMSYTTPGSITVSNVSVGTSRSVPYGDYDLKVMGGAVINNYDDTTKDDYKTSTMPRDGALVRTISVNDKNGEKEEKKSDYTFVWTQDNTESYDFAKYLSVGTLTGTLDKKVSVTIGETTITVDGEAYTMDVAPYIQVSSNSTMVPLRFVSLALGVDAEAVANGSTDETSTITWDANTKTATIFYASGSGQKIIQFTAGSNAMVVDGTSVPMSYGVVAEITDSRMFVPFRALGTALGVVVDWDETTRTATYN